VSGISKLAEQRELKAAGITRLMGDCRVFKAARSMNLHWRSLLNTRRCSSN